MMFVGLFCIISLFCTGLSIQAISDSDTISASDNENFNIVELVKRAAKAYEKEPIYIYIEKFLTRYTRAFTMLDIRSNRWFLFIKSSSAIS